MKILLSLLLVCAVLGELKPEKKEYLRKFSYTIKAMKVFAEKARKLQENTDTTDGGKNLNEPLKNITEEEAGAPQNYDQNSTSTNYRIKGFYGFLQQQSDTFFKFGMIFSFINQLIAKIIRMRLILKYKSTRLRNLETMSPQSVTAECKTSSELAQKETPKQETDIDYECQADKA